MAGSSWQRQRGRRLGQRRRGVACGVRGAVVMRLGVVCNTQSKWAWCNKAGGQESGLWWCNATDHVRPSASGHLQLWPSLPHVLPCPPHLLHHPRPLIRAYVKEWPKPVHDRKRMAGGAGAHRCWRRHRSKRWVPRRARGRSRQPRRSACGRPESPAVHTE